MTVIYSEEFRSIVAGDPLVYVDVGARGGLQGPWAKITDERLRVLAFEPDADACADLAREGNSKIDVVSKALWSHAGTLSVHIAEVAGTSSVHAPNLPLLSRFPQQHVKPRTTLEKRSVECTTLDDVLKELGCRADFLKLDTQGSEYEVLVGASQSLQDCIFGVVAESWTVEVHKGQRLTGDILTFMSEKGFGLFDISVAAAWHRRGADRLAVAGKREIVGLDLLFFKELTGIRERFASPVAAAKAAAISELYGFPDVALEILDMCTPPPKEHEAMLLALRSMILAKGRVPLSSAPPGRLERLRRLFRREKLTHHDAVKLHY
jgi:FkbM family methyltransferase